MNRAICIVEMLVALTFVASPSSAQPPAAKKVVGEGTPGQIPIWIDARSLGDSVIGQALDGTVFINVGALNAITATTSSTSGAAAIVGTATGSSGPWANGVIGEATASPNGIGW